MKDLYIGKQIKITVGCKRFYSVGDVGTISEIDDNGQYWANFNYNCNKQVYGCGIWCVGAKPEESGEIF